MAYDEGLAHRIRDALDEQPGVTEKAMFGGLSFLVHGKNHAAKIFHQQSNIEQSIPELRISTRKNPLHSFVTRHSLIVIRLLLHRYFKLPVCRKI